MCCKRWGSDSLIVADGAFVSEITLGDYLTMVLILVMIASGIPGIKTYLPAFHLLRRRRLLHDQKGFLESPLV